MKEIILSLWNASPSDLLMPTLIVIVILGVLIKIADVSATKRNNKMIEEFKNRRITMNTIEMLKEAEATGGTYKEHDMLFNMKNGFHDEDGFCCEGSAFETLNTLMFLNEWKPYVKPVNWSEVPIDTKVLCRLNGRVYKRHYAGLHCGHPSVWDSGFTSHSTFDKRIAYEWDSVELADATE